MDRRLLGKEQVGPVQGQVAVHLVGGHLMIALDAVFAAGVHHGGGADDVGLQKHTGVLDGAVHMALGGEVHHHVGVLLLKQLVNGLPVADIRLHEAEVGVVHHRSQGGQVSGIGQLVQAYDAVIGMLLEHMEHKVAADKAGAAGNDNGHWLTRPFRTRSCSRCPPAAERFCPCRTEWGPSRPSPRQ